MAYEHPPTLSPKGLALLVKTESLMEFFVTEEEFARAGLCPEVQNQGPAFRKATVGFRELVIERAVPGSLPDRSFQRGLGRV